MYEKLVKICNDYYELCSQALRRSDKENVYLPDPLDILAKYTNAGYYIRFGDSRTKIGLNPNYLGPNIHGIYSFYLDEDLFNKIVSGHSRAFFTRKFIQIIKFTGHRMLDSRSYTINQLKTDIAKLTNLFPNEKDKLVNLASQPDNPAKTIMRAIREVISPTSIANQTKIILLLGYQAVQDHGDGILFGSDKPPGQTVFLSRQFVDIVDIIDNPNLSSGR